MHRISTAIVLLSVVLSSGVVYGETFSDRYDHLVKAATHLESAGQPELAKKARLLASIEELIGRTKRISAMLSPNHLDLFGAAVPEGLMHLDRKIIEESNAALSRLQKGLEQANKKDGKDAFLGIGPPSDPQSGVDKPSGHFLPR